MRIQMSTVRGSEIRKSTTSGFFVLTGMAYLTSLDLPALKIDADASVMLNAFTAAGMPAEGAHLTPSLTNWICVDRSVRPVNALQWQILCIFRWTGALQIRDHTTLQAAIDHTNPFTGKPVYHTWTDPNPAPGTSAHTINDALCDFQDFDPFRNLTYTKTVDYSARNDVLQARKCVNDAPWQGHDPGFWLVTALDGETLDGGITFTYSVTFSTQETISWSSYAFLKDPNGKKVPFDRNKFVTLRAKPYKYGYQDPDPDGTSVGGSANPTTATCPGVARCDRFKTINFPTIFGIDP